MFSRTLAGAVAAALVATRHRSDGCRGTGSDHRLQPRQRRSRDVARGDQRGELELQPELIEFNLPAIAGTVISACQRNLPAITSPVEIDGYTQPGASPASAAASALPGVLIDAVNTTQALALTTDASLIQGLAIHDSSGAAGRARRHPDHGQREPHRGQPHRDRAAAGTTRGCSNLTTGVASSRARATWSAAAVPEDANVIAEIDGDGVAIAANAQRRGRQPARPAVRAAGSGNPRAGSRSPATATGSARQLRPSQRDQREQRPRRGDRRQRQHRRGQLRRPRRERRERRPATLATASTSSATRTCVHGNTASGNSAGVCIDGTSNTVIVQHARHQREDDRDRHRRTACSSSAGNIERHRRRRGRRAQRDLGQHRRRRGDLGGPEPTASRATGSARTADGVARGRRTATAWSWRPAST